MNADTALEALASGDVVAVMAVCLIASAIFNMVQYRRNNQLQDKLLDTTVTLTREGHVVVKENSHAMSRLTEVIREGRR